MDDALSESIEKDLYNELRWLLCAATEWHAHKTLVDAGKTEQPCFHLQVYAMDSALLHARSLYEFFTADEKSVRRSASRGLNRLTWRDYSATARQESSRYNQFMKALHGRVMHLDKDRGGYEEVKNEVVNLASDILSLWKSFSEFPDLKHYAGLLEKKRDEAIREAAQVAGQYSEWGLESPFKSTRSIDDP